MGARSPESTRLAGVFLARHGETDYNAEHRFQGLLPVPLNANGRRQAEQLADDAAPLGFSELWCSPLARARETAEIVGDRLGLSPREDARLVETDTGDWTDEGINGRVRFINRVWRACEPLAARAGALDEQNKFQVAMWLVPPIWIGVMSASFMFRTGLRAWVWLGGASALGFAMLALARHFFIQ